VHDVAAVGKAASQLGAGGGRRPLGWAGDGLDWAA
jgi:hypothetical protein